MRDTKVERTTTLKSLILIVLKELRLEKGLHQAYLAEACGKSPSAWTKIELGQTPITMEIFFLVCKELRVSPSSVLSTAERHSTLLSQNNWAIIYTQLDYAEDHMLLLAQKYYSSEEYNKRRRQRTYNLILNEPEYDEDGNVIISPVFRYIINQDKNIKLL